MRGEAGVVGELGAFVAEFETLPDALARQGKRALLNGLGTALASSRDPAVEQAARAMRSLGADGTAILFGRPERLRPAEAAFVNAIAMNLLDFDDTHLPTVIHPTAPVAPAALAVGEELGSSGAEVLRAFVLGAEIECRIGDMVSPGHYARGWHITSTCGVFGAAAATAKLLGLDAERTAHALALAASLSSGIIENLPTAGKNASVGNAARSGVLAAHLAKAGYEAAPAALEGPFGWARACGDVPSLEAVTRGLGERWAFSLNAIKPYPCGIVFHAEIDACLELRRDRGLAVADIGQVAVRGDQLFLDRGERRIRTVRDARVSLHHAAAAAFLRGRAGIAEFEADFVHSPEAAAFREKVSGRLDASLPAGAVTVDVRTRDGASHAATVLHARGSAERPMSDAEVEDKARGLIRTGHPGCDVDRLASLVWNLDQLDTVGELTRTAAGGVASG